MAAEHAVGAASQYTWVSETAWGTTPSVTPGDMRILAMRSENIRSQIGLVENDSIRADRQTESPLQGNINPGGAINLNWGAIAHGFFVYKMLGNTASLTTAGTDPYTHTIEESQDVEIQPFSLEKAFSDVTEYFVYAGCRVSRINFEYRPESYVQGAVNIEAKNETHAATVLDSGPLSMDTEPLNSFDGELDEGGATLTTPVTEMTMVLDNNIAPRNVINSQFRGSALAGRLRASGTMSVFFTDATLFTKYRDFTESSVRLRMLSRSNHYIEFLFHAIHYGGDTPIIGGEGAVDLPLSFTASRKTSNSKMVTAIVENNLTGALFDV